MNSRKNKQFRSGAVLLVVLIIIMVITVLSLGFLSKSDIELASGRNMVTRSRIDYLSESGLEQTRGLILNPQDVPGNYYTGALELQLDAGSNDYYDIFVEPDSTDNCNYTIDCNAYEIRDGEIAVQSKLRAILRLDPCIALWAGNNLALSDTMTITGDIFCNGDLSNLGMIGGDVFADSFAGTSSSKTGQLYDISELSLAWPKLTVDGYDDIPGVIFKSGDYTLTSDIEGMLLVDGDLTIQDGLTISLTSTKNLPALYVTGNLFIGKNTDLYLQGLVVVDGQILLNDGSKIYGEGGVFAKNGLFEIASDASGNNAYGNLYNGPKWTTGYYNNGLEFDGLNDKVENYSIMDNINGLSEITLSLWIKSDVLNQDRDILYTQEPTYNGADYSLGIRYDRDGAYGGGYGCIKASIETSSGYTQIESSSNVQTTNWQHLALTWKNDVNDSHLKLYIDGIQNSLTYDKGPVYGTITNFKKMMVGTGSKSIYWDGLIDDVRFYARALSDSEIIDVKNNSAVSGLIFHWKFDESGSYVNISAAPEKAAIKIYDGSGNESKWGQAAGAFYKSIERR